MNFFKLYIGDYQRDTAHLSITEHGAYLLMLQHYYATEKPLPVGKALHRMLRAQDKAERDAIDAVASEFWRESERGLVNDRADVEITKAGAQADTNARIAREREAKRKAARGGNDQSTNRATNDQPNQTPDTRHQENFVLSERDSEAAFAAAGAALKRAGVNLMAVNTSDPVYRALVQQGATPEEFESIGREAVEKRVAKPLPWICTVLQDRRARAAEVKLAKGESPAADRAEMFRGVV